MQKMNQRFQLHQHFQSKVKVKVKSLSRVRLFATPWTVAYQAPLSMGFSRQWSWSGLPFPSPGDFPNPEIKPGSPTLQTDALPSEPLQITRTNSSPKVLNKYVPQNFVTPRYIQQVEWIVIIFQNKLQEKIQHIFLMTSLSLLCYHTQISACNRVYISIISRPCLFKKKNEYYTCKWEMGASLIAQMVKNLPAMQETWVQFLGQEDPLEKGMATHSSILAQGIPWTDYGVEMSQTTQKD